MYDVKGNTLKRESMDSLLGARTRVNIFSKQLGSNYQHEENLQLSKEETTFSDPHRIANPVLVVMSFLDRVLRNKASSL